MDRRSFNKTLLAAGWAATLTGPAALAESIRKHPDQQALRQLILEEGGFDEVEVHNLSGGIVALHRAFKY